MAKKTQAQRREQKKKSTHPCKAAQSDLKECEITACEHKGYAMDCCQKNICSECIFNTVRVCDCHGVFAHKCPFCNQKFMLDQKHVKALMAMHCPSHAKVMDGCDNRKFVVAHSPCDVDCYDCDLSHLHIRAL